jgi:hypothetical protein
MTAAPGAIGSAAAVAPRVTRPAVLPPPDARLVVVEASAGTGKTFFLEHRVVDLILSGAELGQILLVTFTDKAVAELRLRIRDLLDRLSRAAVSTERRRGVGTPTALPAGRGAAPPVGSTSAAPAWPTRWIACSACRRSPTRASWSRSAIARSAA